MKYVTLTLLTLVYAMNQWSRYSFNYLSSTSLSSNKSCDSVCSEIDNLPLCESYQCNENDLDCINCQTCYKENDYKYYNLKYATCLDEKEYSFLVSYGFIFLFAFSGLFAGRLSDKYNRKNIIFMAIISWSLCTSLQGFCTNFALLALSRVLLGIAAAFSAPSTYSLLADVFPAEEIGFANGLYSFGVYVGGGLSSLSIILAHSIGWRNVSHLVAALGIFIGLFLFVFVKEPKRGAYKKIVANEDLNDVLTNITEEAQEGVNEIVETDTVPESESINKKIVLLLKDKVFLILLCSTALRFFGGFAIGAYLPQYYKRKFPDQNSEYSILNAFVVSVGGALSAALGGKISDYTSSKYGRNNQDLQLSIRARIPALGALSALPFMFLTLTVDSFNLSMFSLFLAYFLAESWFGPALSIIQIHVKPEIRAFSISMYLLVGSLCGNLSPVIIGNLDDGKTVSSISNLLLLMISISYIGCAVSFLFLSFILRRKSHASI